MRGNIGRRRALANAGFAVAVLALAGFGLYQVAGKQWRVQPTFRVRAQFESIADSRSGIASAFKGSTPAWWSDRRARRAGRAGRADPAG